MKNIKITNSNKYMEEAYIQKQARTIAELKSLTVEEKIAILKFLEDKELRNN